ncbi:MAG: hypothetical protein RR304_08055, partial [Bacteroides sp.]
PLLAAGFTVNRTVRLLSINLSVFFFYNALQTAKDKPTYHAAVESHRKTQGVSFHLVATESA